jgi:hypothetical protein
VESITGELAELIFSIARKTLGPQELFVGHPRGPFDSAGWAKPSPGNPGFSVLQKFLKQISVIFPPWG